MKRDRIPIFNIEVDNYTKKEFLEELKKGVVITPNADHLIKLQKDKEFYNIYQKAEHVIVDSKVVQLGLKFLGKPVLEVLPGSDIFPLYYKHHKDNDNIKIFLLGAAEGVAIKAMEKINAKLGKKKIVGALSPSFGFEQNPEECNAIIETINSSGANILAVGVGAPKQEKWIFKHRDKMTNIDVFMAIGATIDFEAGNVKRAPKIFRKLSLEWLYRLIKEPKRLWRRYLIEDFAFLRLIIREKRGIYSNPFS